MELKLCVLPVLSDVCSGPRLLARFHLQGTCPALRHQVHFNGGHTQITKAAAHNLLSLKRLSLLEEWGIRLRKIDVLLNFAEFLFDLRNDFMNKENPAPFLFIQETEQILFLIQLLSFFNLPWFFYLVDSVVVGKKSVFEILKLKQLFRRSKTKPFFHKWIHQASVLLLYLCSLS